MKILLIAMPDSIHTARWISQIADQGWDTHLFPSIDCGVAHAGLRNVTVHHSFFGKQKDVDVSVKVLGFPVYSRFIGRAARRLMREAFSDYQVGRLKRLIENFKPDFVHSLEIQHAGYLAMKVKKSLGDKFPPWIVTNWGSDIYLFGRLSEHEPIVKEVLANCDFYSCECQRDIPLAREYGFRGQVLPVFPNSGGFDLNQLAALRQPGPVSSRRKIMLKGYQNWAGRALTGLRALERCADLLEGHELLIHTGTGEDIIIAAELFERATGIPTSFVPKGTPHLNMLKLYGEARISIGLSISDGISTSLLEAMVMGAFPIQSFTACADEWIEDGKTGALVHPDDSDIVERAIRIGLTDNALVNEAATANSAIAIERLDKSVLKLKVISFYSDLVDTVADSSTLKGKPRLDA